MKTLIFSLTMVGIGVLSAAQPNVGTHVVPPSQRGYSIQAIRESGERGGLLMAVGTNFTAVYNREMGDAMELWNAHHWQEAAREFNRIWRTHPDSPWAAEAELHEACFLKFNSQYDESEERFVSALKKYPDNPEVRNKALRYLPHLYAQTGRWQAALDAHLQMQKLPLTWQERQHLENYARIFGRALSRDAKERLCGTKALALALASQNDKGEALRNVPMDTVYKRFPWSRQKASEAAGFSLQELADLSGGKPVQTDLEALRQTARPGHPVLVYLKVPSAPKCFEVFEKSTRQSEKPLTGHFLVVERVDDASVDVLDPHGGRGRWSLPQFVYRWSGVALVLPGQVSLRGQSLDWTSASLMRGGCCGRPPPDPSDDPCEDSGASGCSECGAPVYSFGLNSASFRLKDIPIWYPDAKGPGLNVRLSYSRLETQRMAQYTNANFYPFGNKWHFNFASYLTETPDGGAEIVLGHGLVQHFNQTNGIYTSADIWNQNSLIKSNQFVLTFKGSDEKWYFNTNTALQQRLEQIVDKYGNPLTLQYDNGSGRLTNIVDAAGRFLRLGYNSQGYVTNITDAIGRTAVFAYSQGKDLVSVTDMGGLTTTIQYDENHWPTNIIYPSGEAWTVAYQHGASAVYQGFTQPFAMVVTDPIGQRNEYIYHAFDDMGPISLAGPGGKKWVYAREREGADSASQRIFYSAVNPALVDISVIAGDQWEHDFYDYDVNLIERAFANQPYSTGLGDTTPVWIEDVLATNVFDANHNLRSSTLLTDVIRDEPGGEILEATYIGTWTNWYDAHDNLLGAKNPLDQETHYGYDAKDNLTAITNALNHFTLMSYDHNGNMTNLVDALNRTNRWLYDANGHQQRSLYADGISNSFGYDSIGRLNATTNHGSGFFLTYTHDNLDRMRDVIFPDGTTNHLEYSCCGLDWTRDRLNRMTFFGRDAVGRTTQITDPQNRVTEFQYNGADQITDLITHRGSAKLLKHFDYTSTNGFTRLTQVKSPMGKLLKYDYTFRGGLAWREDGKGNVTQFQYDLLERLTSVLDTSDHELVSLDYDVLGNVTRVASTNSVFEYTYDGLNRATQAVCLLTNLPGFATVKYRIDYAFDPVGNVTNRVITGLQGMSETITTRYQYDVMDRLTNVVQLTNGTATASAGYQYDGAGRLWKKTYGNNDVVTHTYDQEGHLLRLGITNNASLVTYYSYYRDAVGNILAITNNGAVTSYGYDAVGQLTNEVSATVTNAWQYDEAGNWISAPGQSQWRMYDSDNELVGLSLSSTNSITVTGAVEQTNRWQYSVAACRGVSVPVSTNNGTFSLLEVPLAPGSNTLVVTVTDTRTGSHSQQTRTVFKTNALETFLYDGNGNLSNWASGVTNWVYEWDWADQLTKVSSNGVVVLQNWYDAVGRRIAKQELVNGQTNKWLYLSDGWDIVGAMTENGQLRETFTRGVGLAVDIGTLVAVTHHPGSATNGTFYIHDDHRGDVVLTRSGATTVGTYDYSAFGSLKTQTETDVCRFKFSSKETDAATGFSYFGYRFYAPRWQRWTSSDPYGEGAGLNLYAYVGNTPVNGIDSLGLAKSPTECAKLYAYILNQAQLLANALAKYDQVQDGKGRFPIWRSIGGKRTFLGFTKPGGHFDKMLDYKRGLLPAIADYIKNCMCDDCDDPPNKKLPKSVWDLGYKKIPAPIYPVSPLIYVPGSDRLWENVALGSLAVSAIAATVASFGTSSEVTLPVIGRTAVALAR